MKVFDEEYDVNRESHRAQVALHKMNFDPNVETFTQYLIKFNELADNAFPEKGQRYVDEMLFATLPHDIRIGYSLTTKKNSDKKNCENT